MKPLLRRGHGIGAVMTSHERKTILLRAKVYFDCTHNVAKYEAYAMRIQATIKSETKILEVYRHSDLVIY